jgi:hypothetical protein
MLYNYDTIILEKYSSTELVKTGGTMSVPEDQKTNDQAEAGKTQPEPKEDKDLDVLSIPRDAFNSRLDQAKRSGVSTLLKDLGYETADDLKAVLSDLAQIRSERETEKERAERLQKEQQKVLDTLKIRAEAAESELTKLRTEALQRQAHDQIVASVKDKVRASDEVIMWAQTFGKAFYDALFVDGVIDGKAVGILVKECEKAKPEWFKPIAPGTPSNANANSMPTGKSKQDLIKQFVRKRGAY